MKSRTFLTIGASAAFLLIGFAILSIFHYSGTQHYTQNLKPIQLDTYQPGETVFLKPGKICGIVIDSNSNGISVCVPDATGGVKTQLVSPLILERYQRW